MPPVQKWIRTKLRRLMSVTVVFGLLTSGVVVAQIAASTPAQAATCGQILLAGSAWLDGNGVNVYSNAQGGASYGDDNCGGGDDYVNGADAGGEWQCVELVNRLYLTRGWITSHWSGNGSSLVSDLPPGLTEEPQNSITSIAPGDVVTLNYSTFGHAAVVNTVTSNGNGTYSVQIVNQNAPDVYGYATWNPSAGTLSSEYSGYTTQAVIHAAANTATGTTAAL
jgi:hypothetical protein